MFQGESGGILAGSVIRRTWRNARKAVLPPHAFESPTGRRVYDKGQLPDLKRRLEAAGDLPERPYAD
ncbi:hypothetical protein OG542_26270 [Streptomyces violaceus]|uniref:hypothetical protein n=1 Tax=Streptomyces violaceus TaxID=1936 RepID=UPI002E1C02AB